MPNYHVGCGIFGIYAGTLEPKNPNLWRNKSEVTDEAITAVRDYMISECLGGIECKKAIEGGWQWTLKDGRNVQLMVKIEGEKMDGGAE